MFTLELLLLCFAFREVVTAVENDVITINNSSSSLIPVNDTSTMNNSTAIIRLNQSLSV